MRLQLNHLLFAIVFTLVSLTVRADQPNPKIDRVMYSENKKVKVFAKIDGRTYAVKNNKRLWTIRRYIKYGYVSDTGEYFVGMYAGGSLLPTDATDDLVLMTLYRYGKPIREVKLKDIIEKKSQLIKTVSHLYWGDAIGFTKPNIFQVKRVDGKIFSFDLTSF